MSGRYVLDSSVVSHLVSYDVRALQRFRQASAKGAEFILCAVVYYEVTRGFIYLPQPKKERAFRMLLPDLVWSDLGIADWQLAAHIWADGRKRGREPEDADAAMP
jgi:predicted nucleic acid-binding protein